MTEERTYPGKPREMEDPSSSFSLSSSIPGQVVVRCGSVSIRMRVNDDDPNHNHGFGNALLIISERRIE